MIDTSNKEIQSDYDFVVVGAGAAGSVLAAELSASGAQVLLIESGGPDDGPTIANPSIWFYNVASPLDYHLPINPSPRLNNRKFNMALGHVLGGGTSINAMVWMRGMQRDYDGWAKNGAKGGPLPTCFRFSRNKRIGKAARMNGAVLVARYTFAGQKILTQPRPLSSTQPARWACPFWPT
jgi:choline dehydrogenase-like flavoprotein